ncbi:MFS transporter [Candidatus Hydrogenedentota bacterium]
MSEERVSIGQKCAYSAMPFTKAIPSKVGALGSLLFLTQIVGLDPLKLGLIAILPSFWDAVTDPLMGAISDRTNTRWGKRRPYIFVGGLMQMLGTSAHWLVPFWYVPWARANGVSVDWVYLLLLINELYNRTFGTIVRVPYVALGAELSDIPDERNKLVVFRTIATNLGMFLGLAIGTSVIGKTDINAYPYLVVSMISLTAIGVISTSVFCRERRFSTIQQRKKPTFKDMAKILTYKPFIMFTVIFLTTQMSFTVTKGLIVFIGRFYLLDNTVVFKFEMLLLVSMTLSLFVWPRILRALGNKRAQLITIASMGFLFSLTYFFFQPYNGEPRFTGKPIQNIGRRLIYKGLLFRWDYTGIDIKDIPKLKHGIRSSGPLGERYFAGLDPETESDDEFLVRLNSFIENPALFEEIKDTPYFTKDSFSDYAALAGSQSSDGSVIAAFLSGEQLSSPVEGSLEVLNKRLADPLFYEQTKDNSALSELPQDLLLMEKEAIPERLRARLAEFSGQDATSFDLKDADFSLEQLRSLGAIMHEEVSVNEWYASLLRKLGSAEDDLEKRAEKKLRKTVNEKLRVYLHLERGETIVPLELSPDEIEKVAFFNRALLEHAYPRAVVESRSLNIQKAKDKLKLMLIRTKHTRKMSFSELDGPEQKDIMTANRLLLAHLFPANVEDSVPTLRMGLVFVFAILVGVVAGGLGLMAGTMIPDLADYDELQTGFRRMGLLFGVESFAVKIEFSVVPLLKGLVLAAIGIRYKVDFTTTPEQLAQICDRLRFAYVAPAVVGCSLAFLMLLFYPLNNARLRKIRQELQERRAAEIERA